jgi:hypothetical protein
MLGGSLFLNLVLMEYSRMDNKERAECMAAILLWPYYNIRFLIKFFKK